MSENILKVKSFAFAVRIVRLFQYLQTEKREYVLGKQLLRSGTSVGAMIREAEYAESRTDFIHKMAIARKEINESIYWLDLLTTTEYLNPAEGNSLHHDAVELLKMLTSTIKTTRSALSSSSH